MAETPVDVLLYCMQCLARSWGEMSHPRPSDYEAPCAELPPGEVPSGTEAAVLGAPS